MAIGGTGGGLSGVGRQENGGDPEEESCRTRLAARRAPLEEEEGTLRGFRDPAGPEEGREAGVKTPAGLLAADSGPIARPTMRGIPAPEGPRQCPKGR